MNLTPEEIEQVEKEWDETLAKLPTFEQAGLSEFVAKFEALGYVHNPERKCLSKSGKTPSGADFYASIHLTFEDVAQTKIVLNAFWSCKEWMDERWEYPYSIEHKYQLSEWQQITPIDEYVAEPPHVRWKKS
jgi:hypothetical protein